MTGNTWDAAAAAIAALNDAGSASTRTHVHKLLYFAQQWRIVEPEYKFSLYLHGPYSHDLDRTLLQMEAFDKLTRQADPAGFGAHYSVEDGHPSDDLQRLAGWLGPKNTRSLEALSTALFVGELPRGEAVGRVMHIKPHLSKPEVQAAVDEVRAKEAEFHPV